MRWAVIDNETSEVKNVILWDGSGELIFAGCRLVEHPECDIGDTHDPETKTFRKPERRANP